MTQNPSKNSRQPVLKTELFTKVQTALEAKEREVVIYDDKEAPTGGSSNKSASEAAEASEADREQ
jgi:hypothetical protein